MRKPDVKAARRTIARNVRRLRHTAKLTQFQAAERAGLHWRHWQKVEAGEVNATLVTLCRVAFGLDVDISALFKAPPRR